MTKMVKLLGATAATALITSGAMAGGLDRSGQSTGIIFKDGHFLEFSGAYVMPEVSGDISGALSGNSGNGQDNYSLFGISYRGEINEQLSYAVIYDQPFGSDVSYEDFTGTAAALNGLTGVVNSDALTFLGRYEFGNGFSVHGGIRAQRLDAAASIPAIPGLSAAYDVTGDAGTEFGPVIGVAYERPDIALRVAATYSAPIEHDVSYIENGTATSGKIEVPESINLEFQTGVNQSTLVFGSIRWANWSEFTITPPGYAAANGGASLVSFADDGIDYNLGVARRINESFVATASIGYQTSTGDVGTSLFSPSDGRISYSLAGIYTVGAAEITAGIRYTDLGDQTVSIGGGAATGDFSGNDAISIGVRVGFAL